MNSEACCTYPGAFCTYTGACFTNPGAFCTYPGACCTYPGASCTYPGACFTYVHDVGWVGRGTQDRFPKGENDISSTVGMACNLQKICWWSIYRHAAANGLIIIHRERGLLFITLPVFFFFLRNTSTALRDSRRVPTSSLLTR